MRNASRTPGRGLRRAFPSLSATEDRAEIFARFLLLQKTVGDVEVVEAHAERRVAAVVERDFDSVDPDGRLAETTVEVQPDRRALPGAREREGLAVPEHVSRDVALARAAVRARVRRRRGADEAVVRQTHVQPGAVVVGDRRFLRRVAGVRGVGRLGVHGRRVLREPSGVLPLEIETDDVARRRRGDAGELNG